MDLKKSGIVKYFFKVLVLFVVFTACSKENTEEPQSLQRPVKLIDKRITPNKEYNITFINGGTLLSETTVLLESNDESIEILYDGKSRYKEIKIINPITNTLLIKHVFSYEIVSNDEGFENVNVTVKTYETESLNFTGMSKKTYKDELTSGLEIIYVYDKDLNIVKTYNENFYWFTDSFTNNGNLISVSKMSIVNKLSFANNDLWPSPALLNLYKENDFHLFFSGSLYKSIETTYTNGTTEIFNYDYVYKNYKISDVKLNGNIIVTFEYEDYTPQVN